MPGSDELKVGEFKISGLDKVNLLVGKNGCGKSTVLRALDSTLNTGDDARFSKKRYISPERGGTIAYEAGVEQAISNNFAWLANQRRKNQTDQFRQQSVALFRQLEITVLRLIERERRDEKNYTFDLIFDQINGLLDQIVLVRSGTSFEIKAKSTNQVVPADKISSGESELISLAIECLAFEAETKLGTESLLLLDEPDVHLHPDLQSRFVRFLCSIVERSGVKVVISTHSTPVLGALADKDYARIVFMQFGTKNLVFRGIGGVMKNLVPVFGAHPLSTVFNEFPVLIVEGEDEERIWQQAVRSSSAKIKVFPVQCGGKGNISSFESEAQAVMQAVYDHARGFSLRDGDGVSEALTDLGCITRLRLACYSSENLILSDEVLNSVGVSWDTFKPKFSDWLRSNSTHPYFSEMEAFVNGNFDRKNSNLKNIRNIILGMLPTNKPWEVLVGKVLASQSARSSEVDVEGSILSFLGDKTASALLPGN